MPMHTSAASSTAHQLCPTAGRGNVVQRVSRGSAECGLEMGRLWISGPECSRSNTDWS
jgi:hypothetical protein